jgi:integrase
MTALNIQVGERVRVKVANLHHFERNPRTISGPRLGNLTASLEQDREFHAKLYLWWLRDGSVAAWIDGSNILRRSFYPLLQRAGLPRVRFHDLRHSAATLMLSRGVPLKIVSEILGHSQISITADTYMHVTPGMQREAAAALDAVLS